MAELVLRGATVAAAGRLVPADVRVAEGKVAELLAPGAPAPGEEHDASGCTVAPGFVDLHVHAVDGHWATDPAALDGLAAALLSRGVTSFLATTVTAPLEDLRSVVAASASVTGGARCLGAHLEGPWISPRRLGAQPAEHVRAPSPPEYADLLAAGPVRLVALAPEEPGGLDLVAAVAASGAVASIGHSDSTYEETRAAVAAGASHVTHCFNAMTPLHHREPGLVGAALDLPGLTVELIADGHHVHPAAARLLWRARGAAGVCLVSDCVDGCAPGLSSEGGATRAAGGQLAGATVGLDAAVRNLVSWGVPLVDALAMASSTPAGVLGRADLGRLEPGAVADLVVLDEALEVRSTYVGGELVWRR